MCNRVLLLLHLTLFIFGNGKSTLGLRCKKYSYEELPKAFSFSLTGGWQVWCALLFLQKSKSKVILKQKNPFPVHPNVECNRERMENSIQFDFLVGKEFVISHLLFSTVHVFNLYSFVFSSVFPSHFYVY